MQVLMHKMPEAQSTRVEYPSGNLQSATHRTFGTPAVGIEINFDLTIAYLSGGAK
jgi:hypothetical protein